MDPIILETLREMAQEIEDLRRQTATLEDKLMMMATAVTTHEHDIGKLVEVTPIILDETCPEVVGEFLEAIMRKSDEQHLAACQRMDRLENHIAAIDDAFGPRSMTQIDLHKSFENGLAALPDGL